MIAAELWVRRGLIAGTRGFKFAIGTWVDSRCCIRVELMRVGEVGDGTGKFIGESLSVLWCGSMRLG